MGTQRLLIPPRPPRPGLPARSAPYLQRLQGLAGSAGGEGRHLDGLLAGGQQDPAVGEADGARGQEEGEARRHEDEGQAGQQAALTRRGCPRAARLVPAQQQGQEGGERGQAPGAEDQRQGARGRHAQLVAQRREDEQVAVQADQAEVEDGGAAAHHVEGGPEQAEAPRQHPAAVQHVQHGRRHHHQPHHQVRREERHQEKVGRVAQRGLRADEGDEQRVGRRRQRDDHAQRGGHPAAAPGCPRRPRAPVRGAVIGGALLWDHGGGGRGHEAPEGSGGGGGVGVEAGWWEGGDGQGTFWVKGQHPEGDGEGIWGRPWVGCRNTWSKHLGRKFGRGHLRSRVL